MTKPEDLVDARSSLKLDSYIYICNKCLYELSIPCFASVTSLDGAPKR